MMAKPGPTQVERGGVRGDRSQLGDVHELRVPVEVAPDQPGTRGSIDVNAGAGGPSHLGAPLSAACPVGGSAACSGLSRSARAARAASARSRSAGGKKSRRWM